MHTNMKLAAADDRGMIYLIELIKLINLAEG